MTARIAAPSECPARSVAALWYISFLLLWASVYDVLFTLLLGRNGSATGAHLPVRPPAAPTVHSSGSARGLLVWKAPLTVNPGAGKAADAERLDGTNSDGFMRYLTRYVTARGRRRPSGYGQPATRWRPAPRGD